MDRKSELEAKKAKLEQMRREKAQKNLVIFWSSQYTGLVYWAR